MSDRYTDYLGEIYRGARMGAESLNSLLPKVEDSKIKNELIREQAVYKKFEDKALEEINKRGEGPEPIKKMQEIMASVGVKMNASMDNSPSHIADIIIQGNNMGIIGMSKTMNDHENADGPIKELADELVEIQKDNIERLRPFL